MRIPVLRGVIDRRILVNFRIDPGLLTPLLPPPFRPKTLRGFGMAGICLIRLKAIRPRRWPSWLGIASENAEHRIAVEWDEEGGIREGVYVSRRDTNSCLNSVAGGRLFPGLHRRAKFTVEETADRFEVALQSGDGVANLSICARRTDQWPALSAFESLDEASAIFQGGAEGYSAAPDPSRLQGLALRCLDWQIEPLEVEQVRSSFFEDELQFPKGSIAFDCALLKRGIEHEWRALPALAAACAC